jgi:hypothetical protein
MHFDAAPVLGGKSFAEAAPILILWLILGKIQIQFDLAPRLINKKKIVPNKIYRFLLRDKKNRLFVVVDILS